MGSKSRHEGSSALAAAFVVLLGVSGVASQGQSRYGLFVGPLNSYQHGVSGDVYVVDSRTIHLKNFNYDGSGPAGYFYVGKSSVVGPDGKRIPDETGRQGALRTYRNEAITLTLPEGMTLNDISWMSVWCDDFSVNFGDIKFPRNLDYPKPKKIDPLPNLEHNVKSDRIVVVDAQTFLIPQFSYDGQAPDAFFWVGKGSQPSASGTKVPDENGSVNKLGSYKDKTIVLTLPGDLTVYDIDYLSVWCDEYSVNFGHVKIPSNLNVPPSLRMLGVAPQTKLNCEVLKDDLALEVRWAVAGESIVIQLVGKLDDKQYVAFGLSGAERRPRMVGGDVVVAWMEHDTGKGFANDYYLEGKGQCAGESGACPDEVFEAKGNNVRLLNTALVNGFTMITYQRPLKASDRFDQAILTDKEQAVIWAVGSINSQGTASYHNNLRNSAQQNILINFGRQPQWNCPIPEDEAAAAPAAGPPAAPTPNRRPQQPQQGVSRPGVGAPVGGPVTDVQPWFIPPIPCYEPEDGVFYAHIGPTGGKAGYESIAGRVGWGVAWYINGLLIPEITVVRGKQYTFVVEAGNDRDHPVKFHPFYITDDSEGGYAHKSAEERKRAKIFAGVEVDNTGNVVPTGFGRTCQWTENPDQPASLFPSFGAYQRSLTLKCEDGQPGLVYWTPDENTPDTVYYQCFTHRHLGWKIHVVDRCTRDKQFAGSHLHVTNVSQSENGLVGSSLPVPVADDYEAEASGDPYVDEILPPEVPYPSRGLPHQADRRSQYVDAVNFRNKNKQNKDESESKSSLPVVKKGSSNQHQQEDGFGEEGPQDVPVSFSSFPEFGQKKTEEENKQRPGIGKEEVKDGVVIIEAVPISHGPKPSHTHEQEFPSPVYVASDIIRGQQQRRPPQQNEVSVPPKRRPVPLGGFKQHTQSHQGQESHHQGQDAAKEQKPAAPAQGGQRQQAGRPPVQQQLPQRPNQPQPADRPFKIELPAEIRPSTPIDDPRLVLPEAQNKGFLPNTVILESGFKPIRKDTDPVLPPTFERQELRPVQVNAEGQGPVVNGNLFDSAIPDNFNPVFRPSPTELPEGGPPGQQRPNQGAIIRPVASIPPRGSEQPPQEPPKRPSAPEEQKPSKPAEKPVEEDGTPGEVFFPEDGPDDFPADFEESSPQEGPGFGQQRPPIAGQRLPPPPGPSPQQQIPQGFRPPQPPQFLNGPRPGGRPIHGGLKQGPGGNQQLQQQQQSNRPFLSGPPVQGQLRPGFQQIPFRQGQPGNPNQPGPFGFGLPPPPGAGPFPFRPQFIPGPNGQGPPPGFRGQQRPRPQQGIPSQDQAEDGEEEVFRPPPGNNRRQGGNRPNQKQKNRRRRPNGGNGPNRRRRPEPENFEGVNVDRADVGGEEPIFAQEFRPDPKFGGDIPPGLGDGVTIKGQRPVPFLRAPFGGPPGSPANRPFLPNPAFRNAGPGPVPFAPRPIPNRPLASQQARPEESSSDSQKKPVEQPESRSAPESKAKPAESQGSESEILKDVWSTIDTQSSGQRGPSSQTLAKRSGFFGKQEPLIRRPRSAEQDSEPEPETSNHHKSTEKGASKLQEDNSAESEPEPSSNGSVSLTSFNSAMILSVASFLTRRLFG